MTLTTTNTMFDRSPEAVAASIGGGGAAALKRHVTEAVNEFFAPIRARRAELAQDRHLVSEVLAEGNQRARGIAADTLRQVHGAMGTSY